MVENNQEQQSPEQQGAYPVPDTGLYSFRNEHDACGVGLVANLNNHAEHRIVEMGITVLKRLMHRGAAGGDPAEGAGLIAAAEKLLPPDDYEIVIMCAVAGYRRREVAKIKGMPVSTVSHRYKSALSKLKKYLEEEERQ